MPLFGAHLSISGGYYKALEAASELNMDTVQLFTKNNNQWEGKLLTDSDAELFQTALKKTGLKDPVAHDSYLINLASPDEALYQRSLKAFIHEMERSEKLGISYLVMHPGSATDGEEEPGLKRIAKALDQTQNACAGYRVQILLETTAGQGTSLGHRFDHLARILELVKSPDLLGVCFDTCHVFAAGYPLGTTEEYQQTMGEFDQKIGLKKIKVFHMNDSKKPQGSRVDRHEHLGKGFLGLEPFRNIVNDIRFSEALMILETPKEEGENEEMDAVNLEILRKLVNPI